MSILLWLFVGVVIIFLGVAGFFVFKGKKNKKFKFLVFNKNNPDHPNVVEASIVSDSKNKSEKRFSFPNNTVLLPLRPADFFIGNVGYRRVMVNNRGDYTYLEPSVINDDLYIKTAVSPEERSLIVSDLKDNARLFENPVSRMQAVMLLTGFVLIFLLGIGAIYATITYVGAAEDMAKGTGNLVQTAQAMNQAQSDNLEIQARQLQVIGALNNVKCGGSFNVSRVLS